MSEHDQALSSAFNDQAAKFERAPVQSDPGALGRLVEWARLPAGSRILDAGCGPGLVAEAFLKGGHEVHGVDLSTEMIERARIRCSSFGDKGRFECRSLYSQGFDHPFDAAVSRYVLHHVENPAQFLRRQLELVRPGGIVVISDHTTDTDPERAALHERLERGRDKTHTRNLTCGGLVDLFASCGLEDISAMEERFCLDFDEWFDRGSPSMEKSEVLDQLLAHPGIRGFDPIQLAVGKVEIRCYRAVVRGVKPLPSSVDRERPA